MCHIISPRISHQDPDPICLWLSHQYPFPLSFPKMDGHIPIKSHEIPWKIPFFIAWLYTLPFLNWGWVKTYCHISGDQHPPAMTLGTVWAPRF